VLGPDRAESLDDVLARLDALVEAFENHPDPDVRERAIELLQAVDTVHRAGLKRLATSLDGLEPATRRRVLADRAVRVLLELYDLLPADAPSEPAFVPLGELKIVRVRRS
jgi:hypothetical protein